MLAGSTDGSTRPHPPPLHVWRSGQRAHYALHALLGTALIFALYSGPLMPVDDPLLGRRASFGRRGSGAGPGEQPGDGIRVRPRVVLFHHITAINQWQDIVRDQLAKVIYSGLYARMDASYATCTAVNESAAQDCTELVTTYGAKFQVMSAPVIEGEDTLMERRTLYEIKNRTISGDLVMYFHSKGVSARRDNQREDWERRIWQWRSMMEFFLIYRHEACIAALEAGDDSVGVNYNTWGGGADIVRQWSGNFWWASADYYRTLPDEIEPDSYLGPENYVLKNARNVTLLWSSRLAGEGHYEHDYPPINYADIPVENLTTQYAEHLSFSENGDRL